MVKYEMKYMFDWGSGTCLWSENEAAREAFDYPVKIKALPISHDLKKYLYELIERHDEALNWASPTSGLMWNEEEQKSFIKNATEGYERLCRELNDEFQIRLAKLI